MATLREIKERIRAVASMLLVMVAVWGFCGTSVQAQSKFGFGPKAGIGFAKFWGESTAGAKFRTGFSGGGFIFANVNEQVRVQTEILYVMKGSNIDGGSKSSHSYIAFPLLLKYLMPVEGSVRPNLFIGGEVAFNLSAKLVNGTDFDIKEFITDYDLGLVVGGELGFYTNSGIITVDLRFSLGLKGLDDMGAGLDFKHNVISLMVGYVI